MPRYHIALQKPSDDPLVQELVQELQRATRYKQRLQRNLVEQTESEARWLEVAAREAQSAYEHDHHWFATTLQDMSEVANKLDDLDDEADAIIDYLDDLYALFAEAELEADQKGYPDNHPIYRLVDLLDELLGTGLD